jgi:hypothetical protein
LFLLAVQIEKVFILLPNLVVETVAMPLPLLLFLSRIVDLFLSHDQLLRREASREERARFAHDTRVACLMVTLFFF